MAYCEVFPGVAETIVGSPVCYYGVGTAQCLFNLFNLRRSVPAGVLPYISYIGICRPKVRFLRRFGVKTGIHALCPFWSRIGYGFRGNYGNV